MQLKMPSFQNTSRELTYSDFSGGLNLKDSPSLIGPNFSPQMQNVRVRDRTITQRPGYRKLYDTSLGVGKIMGLGTYHKSDGTDYRLIAHGTKLYTQDNNLQPAEIKSGLTNSKATFFTLADISYMLNGANYLSYNGVTCVDVVGYAPTVLVGRSPLGAPNAGEVYENFNLISSGFKISFTADGTAAYTIPYTNLDSATMVAVVDGVTKLETTDFTVNRVTGVVTFLIAPIKGNPDNVIITCYKASLAHPEYIKNCTIAEVYGGKTSATVFFTGNPNFPDQVWHSRLYGENFSPDYWPDDAWQKVPGNVVGLSHLYDYLLVIHSKGHGALSYIDGPGSYPVFPYADINSAKGSNIPGSVQEVNNSVVFASKERGIMQATSDTTVNNFLSVNDLSDLINRSAEDIGLGLLYETNLVNAVSYNFNGYYGLCVNDVCYVWDFKTNAWLYDTNIPASCFAVINETLCFGSNAEGIVYQFDPLLLNDDVTAIDAWYDTREENAGTPTMVKVVNRVNLVAKPMRSGSVELSFRSRRSNMTVALNMQTSAFSYAEFSYKNFTYNTSFYPVVKRKRMAKRANYFQFRFGNSILDEGMSVISLRVEFDAGTEMR